MICFDFDGTLTTRNSFLLLLLDAGGWQNFAVNLLKESFSLVLTGLGLKSKSAMKEQLFGRFFYRWSEEKFASLCDYSAKKNKHILRPEMMQRIDDALAKDEKVVVVTSSAEQWVKAYLNEYPQVEIIGTVLDVYQGQLSGRFKSPNCVGMEKVRRLQELYPDKKEYYLSVFGDSKDDIELLDLADEGHFVGK